MCSSNKYFLIKKNANQILNILAQIKYKDKTIKYLSLSAFAQFYFENVKLDYN